MPQVHGSAPFTFTVEADSGEALPEGLTVDPSTGELNWTPTASQVGTHALRLRVTNAAGEASQAFEVVVECSSQRELPLGCGCASSGGLLWGLLLLGAALSKALSYGRGFK